MKQKLTELKGKADKFRTVRDFNIPNLENDEMILKMRYLIIINQPDLIDTLENTALNNSRIHIFFRDTRHSPTQVC